MRALALAVITLTAAPSVTVTAPGQVTALAADGGRVAFSSGCGDVRVWTPPARTPVRLAAPRCEQTSTGSGVGGLALAGRRALWVTYTGGNTREWSLWTASTTRPRPRRLRFLPRDVDAPQPIVVGHGDGSRLGDILPYAFERQVIALRADGSRRFSWSARSRVVALAADDGELAVAQEGGVVAVLDASGRLEREETFAGEVSALAVTGTGLLVQRGRTLELRPGRTWSLPAGAKLQGTTGDRAFYAVGERIRSLSLSSGSDHPFATARLAAPEGATVAVAAGRTVRALRAE